MYTTLFFFKALLFKMKEVESKKYARRTGKHAHYRTGQCQFYSELDGFRVRTGCQLSSVRVGHTFIRRTLASKRSCLTVFWAMARLLVAALLFDMTGSKPWRV